MIGLCDLSVGNLKRLLLLFEIFVPFVEYATEAVLLRIDYYDPTAFLSRAARSFVADGEIPL